ncbi:hypothetical protein F0562_003722 [Nyssa sinensis]|uniref:Uncharacterized protein n=1 Tax=Nyssa sinensis TaxID=561372 RepID=A0A5J5BXQ0_9ASTE|nr:hypothetical protein F0562_003722 [Nyssa sinensis]
MLELESLMSILIQAWLMKMRYASWKLGDVKCNLGLMHDHHFAALFFDSIDCFDCLWPPSLRSVAILIHWHLRE